MARPDSLHRSAALAIGDTTTWWAYVAHTADFAWRFDGEDIRDSQRGLRQEPIVKASFFLKAIPQMLFAPIRVRRSHPRPPSDPVQYERQPLSDTLDQASTKAADVPKVFSTGQTTGPWPEMFLADCDEPIVAGAPDLRGVWQVHRGPLRGHIERIEQAGDRVIITTGSLIHDMFADGTLEGGVNDVAETSGESIQVAARFEDGRLNLYPGDRGIVAVTRYLDGDEMVWRWGPWRNRLRRLSGPNDAA